MHAAHTAVRVFDPPSQHLVNRDHAACASPSVPARRPCSEDTKREVDNYREQIAAKNAEIADLNRQIENVGKDPHAPGITQMS